jgi:hypothetical protein
MPFRIITIDEIVSLIKIIRAEGRNYVRNFLRYQAFHIVNLVFSVNFFFSFLGWGETE